MNKVGHNHFICILIKNLYPDVDTAVIYARNENNDATYVGEILGHDKWIDLPWENLCDRN